MGQTIVEKIAQTHLAEGPKRPLRTGDFVSIRPHHVMTHDNTSAVVGKLKGVGGKKSYNPKQPGFALPPDILNKKDSNTSQNRGIAEVAKKHRAGFSSAGLGGSCQTL